MKWTAWSLNQSLIFSSTKFPTNCAIFHFYLEDFWLLKAIENIENTFPKAEWVGIFDPKVLSNYADFEVNLSNNRFFKFEKKKNCQITALKELKSFKDASTSISESEIQEFCSNAPFFVISPTHIISRFRCRFFSQKYPNLQVISLDAHADISSGLKIENLWISQDLLPLVCYIGPKSSETSQFPFQFESVRSMFENIIFLRKIQNKPVFLTIDLDFFSKSAFGLSCYWFRQLFLGHSLNIHQRLQSVFFSSPPGSEAKSFTIGSKLGYFEEEKAINFLKWRKNQIKQEAYAMRQKIILLIRKLQELSCPIVGVDITEVCSLGDVSGKTTESLRRLISVIKDIRRPIFNESL